MWYLINQIVLCLLIALILGFVVAWLLQTTRFGRRLAAMELSWQSKSDFQTLEMKATLQQLEAAAAGLEALKTASTETRQKLDALEGSLNRRDAVVRLLQETMSGAGGDLHMLGRNFTEQQARVTELESKLKIEAEAAGSLRAELVDQRQVLEAREKALKELTVVASGLPQMSARIEECGSRLKAVEAQHQTKNQKMTEEVGSLKKRLAALEPLSVQLAERDGRLKSLESEFESGLQKTGEEVGSLNNRLTALESAISRHAESDARLEAFEAEYRSNSLHMEGEVEALRKRLIEVEPLASQLAERDVRSKAFENEYQSTLRKTAEEMDTLRKRLAALEPVPAQLKDRDLRLKTLESDQEARLQTISEEIRRMAGQLAVLEPLSAQMLDRNAKMTALESEYQSKFLQTNEALNTLQNRLAVLETPPSQPEQHADRLANIASQYQATLRQTAEDVTALKTRLSDLDLLSARIEETNTRLRALEGGSAEPKREKVIEVETAQVRVPKKSGQPERTGEKDDLKQIHGIGPVLERILHNEGIYLFRQIADWTNEEVEQISQKLGAFRDRIKRDDWISSAKKLHLLKYGEGR